MPGPVPDRTLTAPIYLDYHATTPVDKAVLEAMEPYFRKIAGNPASAHQAGVDADAAVREARSSLAELLGAAPREIVFTSGATEANNLALLGAADAAGDRRGVVTFAAEHPAVLEPAAALSRRGLDVTVLGVDSCGSPDLDALEEVVDDSTLIVSLAAANHEIGTLAPVGRASEIAHRAGALFHTDAAQAVGKLPIDVRASAIDLLSLSAHKFYGPKGVGALFVAAEAEHRLRPLLHGGGQERGLRSGTLNVPGIVGLGAAAQRALEVLPSEPGRIAAQRDHLHALLSAGLEAVELNGAVDRLAGNLNLRIPGVEADALVARCASVVAFSAGSACASATPGPSPVLRAIGKTDDEAEESIRLCVGRPTADAEITRSAEAIITAAREICAAANLAPAGVPV